MSDRRSTVGRSVVAVFSRRGCLPALMVAGGLAVITLYFVYALEHVPFLTVSPDSIQFMHFWQSAVEQCHRAGGGVKQAVLAAASAVQTCNDYDGHRGRYLQCAVYALDGLTRGWLPSCGFNLWMMILLTFNAGLISWVAMRGVRETNQRMLLFCLGAATVATTALSISPAMLLILYAKYLWIPFVLLFFVLRNSLLRAGCLTAAAFTDEIGLFSAMILAGMGVVHYLLAHPGVDHCTYRTPLLRVLGACGWGALVALAILFMFYGVSAVLLNVGATNFRVLSFDNTRQVVHAYLLSGTVHDVLWRAEVLVFGTLLGFRVLTAVVGLAVVGIVALGFWRQWRTVVLPLTRGPIRWDERMRDWLGDRRGHFYTFWIVMLLLIVVLVLPRQGGDLTHYSYPAAAVLSVLFMAALVDIFPVRVVTIVLSAVLVAHACLAPHAVALTSQKMTAYLTPDGTVTVADLLAINRSVREFKETGASATFAARNNGQEIQFNGQWFYTRVGVQKFRGFSNPYFPFQGTVRVLLWPHPLDANASPLK